MEFDRCQADAYSAHLAEVNDKRDVVANSDIYNASGLLLVAKGGAITARVASQMARHKLQRPLAESVDVAEMLHVHRVLSELQQLLADSPALAELHTPAVEAAWNCYLPALFQHRLLVQKLTVLSVQLPHVYRKAVLGAWFYSVLASALHWPGQALGDGLLAGLLRDIGYLHLEPALVRKNEAASAEIWSPEEWRALHSHPIIARLILADQPGLSPAVAQAILEHHERFDGSGYPQHIAAERLSNVGWLLGFADALQAQWLLRLQPYHSGLGGFKPLLQSGMLEFPDEAQQVALRLVAQQAPAPARRHADPEVPAFVAELLRRQAGLRRCFLQMQEAAARTLEPARVLRLIQRIVQCCNRSGLLSPELERWCHFVGEEHLAAAYDEMEEIGILLAELEWQFRRLGRELDGLAEAGKPGLPAELDDLHACLCAIADPSSAELMTDLAIPEEQLPGAA